MRTYYIQGMRTYYIQCVRLVQHPVGQWGIALQGFWPLLFGGGQYVAVLPKFTIEGHHDEGRVIMEGGHMIAVDSVNSPAGDYA